MARLFGEDPKSAQPEDLFGTFDVFLEAFKDAQKDLENTRKKEEEEERKKKEVEVSIATPPLLLSNQCLGRVCAKYFNLTDC